MVGVLCSSSELTFQTVRRLWDADLYSHLNKDSTTQGAAKGGNLSQVPPMEKGESKRHELVSIHSVPDIHIPSLSPP